MVCMASSFHWPNFAAAVREFSRILKPGGLFMALWNTRCYESNPLLAEIEGFLHKLVPDIKRVSSKVPNFATIWLNACAGEKNLTCFYLKATIPNCKVQNTISACGNRSTMCVCRLEKSYFVWASSNTSGMSPEMCRRLKPNTALAPGSHGAEISKGITMASSGSPPGGRVIWITGLSGAGKSTLARALMPYLPGAVLLDGDELRAVLGTPHTGF